MAAKAKPSKVKAKVKAKKPAKAPAKAPPVYTDSETGSMSEPED